MNIGMVFPPLDPGLQVGDKLAGFFLADFGYRFGQVVITKELCETCPPKRSPVIMLDWNLERGNGMVRKGYTPEQIINKLREAEILLNQGATVVEASRKIGVTEQTYYRWRKEYGGMRVEQARKLKDLEKENARLKKLVADLSLDNAILKEVAEGNF